MSAILASMTVSEDVTNNTRVDGQITNAVIVSERHFQMQLILTPDGDSELEKLGFVDLRIDCKPRELPDMTRQETVAWLVEKLKRML